MAFDKFLNAHAFAFLMFFFSWSTAFLIGSLAVINESCRDFILRPQIIGKIYRRFWGYSDKEFTARHTCPRKTLSSDRYDDLKSVVRLINSIRITPEQRLLLIKDLFLLGDEPCLFGSRHFKRDFNDIPSSMTRTVSSSLDTSSYSVLSYLLESKKQKNNSETLGIFADWLCQFFASECLVLSSHVHYMESTNPRTSVKKMTDMVLKIFLNPKTPRDAVFNNFKVLLERLDPYLDNLIIAKDKPAPKRLDPNNKEFIRKVLLSDKVTQAEISRVAGWPYPCIQDILSESPFMREEEQVIVALTLKGNV